MALRFRHDPVSFKLPKDILKDVYRAKGEFKRYIFGYTVLFTEDKINKLRSTKLRAHSFPTFQKSFFQFLNKQKGADKSAAQADFGLKKRTDPYAEHGEYDRDGKFIGKFKDLRDRKKYEEEMEKENEEYADPNLSWEDYFNSLSAEEQAWYQRGGRSESDGGNIPDPSGQNETVDPFKYEETSSTKRKGDSSKTDNSSKEKEKDTAAERAAEEARKREKQERQSKDTSGSSEKTGDGDGSGSSKKSYVPPPPVSTSATGRFRLRAFDLSSLQRPKKSTETHVPVKRGDYSKVRSCIVHGPDGGYVITGPTGCGKSTVALLKLFTSKEIRVLVVEPTQANAANIEHEFRHILPNLVARVPGLGTVPDVAFRALTTLKEPLPQLVVTTTEKVLEYFNYHGSITQFDYLVLDEFHLPIPEMVETVELLRTFNVCKKYILVSATAQGFKVHPQLPKAVTRVVGVLPLGKLPAVLEGSDLDPRVFADHADGTYAVVTPSVTMSHTLYKQYREWNIRTFLITRNTYASDYLKAVRSFHPRTAFVMEPGVEAGVTISMAVLASMGATMAVRYDGDVVIEDIQPLDADAGTQRGSRGGRVVPTIYIEPEAPKNTPKGSSANYYRAQAIIKVIALGADPELIRDNGIFGAFPRLKTVTRELALAALEEGGDPFISIYRHNDAGEVFVECGGKGGGFEKLAKSELKLYHWPKGYFVAPIADFSKLDSQPDTFVLRKHQLLAARRMVETIPGLADKYALADLVTMLIGKMGYYANDLFDLLKSIFVGDKPASFCLPGRKDQAPEIEDFLGSGPEVLRLFNHMATEPVGIKYIRKVSSRSGTTYAEHSFAYNGKQLNFSFPEDYTMRDGGLNVDKLSRNVFAKLQHILAVEILVRGAPEKCVDLMKYSERVSHEHIWFTRVREHSSEVNSSKEK